MTFVYCDDIHFTRIEGDKFWVNFVYCKIIDSNLTLTPQICFTIIILELSWTQRKYLLKIHHPSFKTTY